VITSKPASLQAQDNFFAAQFGLRGQVFLGAVPFYTDLTWAEDMATQGCDQSADPAAGMAGRRKPPQRKWLFWRQSGKSQGFGDGAPK